MKSRMYWRVSSTFFGGRVKRVDDTAAKAVKGVRQIVQLDDVVAVVADHMGDPNSSKSGLSFVGRSRHQAGLRARVCNPGSPAPEF